MKIFAIDTSTKYLCLAAADETKVYEYNVQVGTKLSAVIAPSVKRVLESLGWKPSAVDYFACGQGPGSFTGIRVGMAFLKGLAWSLKKPVVGVSTLDVLALNPDKTDCFMVPVLDARRKLVYSAVYRSKNHRLTRISEYMLLTPEQFSSKIKTKTVNRSGMPVYVFGDGADLCRRTLSDGAVDVRFLDPDYCYPRGSNIIELAKAKAAKKEITDPFRLEPFYLYPKECQIRQAGSK